MADKAWNPYTRRYEPTLHPVTEHYVEAVNKYCSNQTGGKWHCYDWFYDQGITIQDDLVAYYANSIEGAMGMSDNEIIDEYFWQEDWDEIESYLYAEADRQIEWWQQYGSKECAE